MSAYGFNDDKSKHLFKLKTTALTLNGNPKYYVQIQQSATASEGTIKTEGASNITGTSFESWIDSGNNFRLNVQISHGVIEPLGSFNIPIYGTFTDNFGEGTVFYLGNYLLTMNNGVTVTLRLSVIKENSKYKLKTEYAVSAGTTENIILNVSIYGFNTEIA